MRILLGALLILLLNLAARPGWAQTSTPYPPLTGQVVNSGHRPLAGVSILVMGTTLSTTANWEGAFLLPVPGPGTYSLRFDYPAHLLTDVVVTDTTRRPLRVTLFSTQPPVRARRPKS
ncbi:carboxypeptidase regulatory-like domain-containing protein [Hymenobacter cellulosilyticus]|uniref:Carboxypeptidase-like regulatory domain-containing protein n=1 Tax=Hymenobacter cellulosilyticus TaxID=2932248 RepID=A0A8T9Q6Y6_9BACT|nr:carboxypeptidase regulatory-like domain-containing protein [Hymenobacter cellulosilyticus]UOQ71249.1 carboxypeptidase-like regulatory domain-containing protein [Hymenobacter cellulosilyticus]